MKLERMLLGMAAVAGLAGIAYLSQVTEPAGAVDQAAEPTGSKMAAAATKFLMSLSPESKAKATFAFDDKERTKWHFIPLQDEQKRSTRKGLRIEEMNAEQKTAALELLRAGTSNNGYAKATTIMSLESILADLEKNGKMVRNSGWYFFTIFGTPSKTDKWGWRVEGHHLALNFTLEGGKVISSTPAFFGANPALVMGGARKGLRTLPEAEDLAKDLFRSLDEAQKKVAHQDKQFPDVDPSKPASAVGEPKGVAAAKMTGTQRDLLTKLLESYTTRMPGPLAEAEMKQVKEAGIDKVHFAYAGGLEAGKPHTYRIQGPTFVVEFLNVQADSANNPANHIHSSWRNMKGEFGN